MSRLRMICVVVMFATLCTATAARAQFRNNGIYLPQVGYMSLSLFDLVGDDTFGSRDAGIIGLGGQSSLGYNFWLTYRLWLGFSQSTANNSNGPTVLTTLSVIPGIRYNFLNEEIRPFVELGFHYLWFLYTENTAVPVNTALGNQAMFGGPRLALGLEWFFYDEMSISVDVAAETYVTIGTFFAPGVTSTLTYTVYW